MARIILATLVTPLCDQLPWLRGYLAVLQAHLHYAHFFRAARAGALAIGQYLPGYCCVFTTRVSTGLWAGQAIAVFIACAVLVVS